MELGESLTPLSGVRYLICITTTQGGRSKPAAPCTKVRKEAAIMMLFKACPRCNGDLRETTDLYGRYVSCIQCGHTRDLPDVRFGVKTAGQSSNEDAAAA
jgi:hypothetical protein